MARAGLSREAVVRIAVDLVDAGGPGGFADLTLAKVAAQAGVATPSLYKHVGSLAALRREVCVVAVEDYTRALTDATVGLAGPDAVAALAHATRRYARAHPGRYAAVQVAPDPDDPADAALSAAASRSVQVVAAVLRGFDLPEDRTIDAIRSVRASLHGFVALEVGGGYRLHDDLDRSFDLHVRAVLAGLGSLSQPD
ncbi:TetR/AcrR family transcriptional regulator [Cellulosimicrobium composti]|uniref:TetR family transcriptional regulator n=1 Tax=Cellulosimicrobium composti TaxID=2672572 RepID=A0A6N7ZLK0_9MICO|nr:TetR-like C-terminal domain-containing protein [Cellulosimicrobium composti]MTG90302.1 TetR family transcriptional regulator [Cellulosimicrobium composti]NDO89626.1 TetR/AcrR family transcriptional regulator [Cellulosimicrobium composti]